MYVGENGVRGCVGENGVRGNSLEGYTKRDLSLDPLTVGR